MGCGPSPQWDILLSGEEHFAGGFSCETLARGTCMTKSCRPGERVMKQKRVCEAAAAAVFNQERQSQRSKVIYPEDTGSTGTYDN